MKHKYWKENISTFPDATCEGVSETVSEHVQIATEASFNSFT